MLLLLDDDSVVDDDDEAPLRWIARAVHYDEHRLDVDAELLLQVPLEAGRLYDSTKFAEALRCLHQQAHCGHGLYRHGQLRHEHQHSSRTHTNRNQSHASAESAAVPHPSHREDDAPSGEGSRKKRSKGGTGLLTARPTTFQQLPRDGAAGAADGGTTKAADESHGFFDRKAPPPPYALAPVVLSGLIAALQHQRQQQQLQEDAKRQGAAAESSREAVGPAEDLSSELVLACHALRRAALRRAKIRNGRKRALRFVPPLLVTLAFVVAYVRSIRHMRSALVQLRYVRSCDVFADARRCYEATCRLAEAELWDAYGTALLDLPASFRALSARTAMHSVLITPTLSRQDVEAGRRLHPHPARGSPLDKYRSQGGTQSIVNRLVREAVDRHRDPNLGVSILDVGCGVGGTLDSLLPPYTKNDTQGRTSPTTSLPPFRYRGIALSAAEVHHATKLVEHRSDLAHVDVAFEQRSFDSPLKRWQANESSAADQAPFTVMVAIESLSYSRNLKETMSNLLAGLQSGGIMVIVDDVVLPSDAGRVAVDPGFRRPSLVTHNAWNALFADNNCTIVEGYDLTFEHAIVWTNDLRSASVGKADPFGPALWPLSSVLNVVASSSETLWRRGVWWERWFAASAAARRMVQLHDGRAELSRAARKRRQEYQVRDSLSYQLYVCRKQ
jgi:hypothetical protein